MTGLCLLQGFTLLLTTSDDYDKHVGIIKNIPAKFCSVPMHLKLSSHATPADLTTTHASCNPCLEAWKKIRSGHAVTYARAPGSAVQCSAAQHTRHPPIPPHTPSLLSLLTHHRRTLPAARALRSHGAEQTCGATHQIHIDKYDFLDKISSATTTDRPSHRPARLWQPWQGTHIHLHHDPCLPRDEEGKQ